MKLTIRGFAVKFFDVISFLSVSVQYKGIPEAQIEVYVYRTGYIDITKI
jgi:hypothetical protein